jgi:hypothetical protein
VSKRGQMRWNGGKRSRPQFPPKVVYRFFDVKDHARQLLEGKVWVSTLEWCRTCDSIRADKGEGSHHWKVPKVTRQSPQSERRRVLDQLAAMGHLEVGGDDSKGELEDVQVFHKIPDAYVFCTSTRRNLKRFGTYCVQISRPENFFLATSQRMLQVVPRGTADMSYMTYGDRLFEGVEGPGNVHPGFLGPKANEDEDELRMLWTPPRPQVLNRFVLDVPEVAHLCTFV